MKKKQIVDLITAVFLILCGTLLLIFPTIKILDVKRILIIVFIFYSIINLFQFLTTKESKDYEGLFTAIASLIVLIITLKINIESNPWNLALTLLIWIILMSLIKLKKCDYYNDQKSKIWIIKVISLVLFVLTGLLAAINLYYSSDVQILILGFFFYIHGILELVDPLTIYISEKE